MIIISAARLFESAIRHPFLSLLLISLAGAAAWIGEVGLSLNVQSLLILLWPVALLALAWLEMATRDERRSIFGFDR